MPSRMMAGVASCSSTSPVESPPSDTTSVSRQQRNLAEKQRRDKLNGYISELATIVPMVSMTTKRLDKTSILRLSAAHLRIYHSPLNPKKFKKKFSWGPEILNSDHLNELLTAAGGFLLIASHTGKILYVSSSVENYLGQQNIEMIGHSLFSFIHPSDVEYVQEKLKALALISAQRKKSSVSARCTFSAHMRERSQPRSETVNHQLMQLSCTLDVDDDNGIAQKPKSANLKRSKSSCTNNLSGSILKAFIKPLSPNPLNELSVTEAFQDEYITRHGIDGKILYADHRISTITGHLPHEVHGMSAYEYICDEDIPVAIFAHNRMFSSSDGTGLIVYRLRTRNQTAVYLKSTGHLQYEKSSTKVHHFVCINKLLGEEEGEKELKRFIEQHTPHIDEKSSPTLHPLLSSLKPGEVSQLLEVSSAKQGLLPVVASFSSASESAISIRTNSNSPLYSCEPSVMSSTVSSLSVQSSNSHVKHQSDDIECLSVSNVEFGVENNHSPNKIFDQRNSHFNYVTLDPPVNGEDISENYSNGFINGYSRQESPEIFDQKGLGVLQDTFIDSLITFPNSLDGQKRPTESYPNRLSSFNEIDLINEAKQKHQKVNFNLNKSEANIFSVSLACHKEVTSISDSHAWSNGFSVPEFENSLPRASYGPDVEVNNAYKTDQGTVCLEKTAIEYQNNSSNLLTEKDLCRVFDNLIDYKASEDINGVWYPNKSSITNSNLQENRSSLPSSCNHFSMPSSRYSAESNLCVQNYSVNDSQE